MNEMTVYKLNEMGNLRKQFFVSFYHAFKNLPQTLLRRIWNVDDINEEIKLKTDENDVFVIPWLVDGNVCAYFVYKETRTESFSQLKYFGFENNIHQNNAIEVLTMFRTNAILSSDNNLKRDFLMNICRDLLLQKGYKFVHATCTEKILPLYLRWGLDVIEQIDIEGVKRFHIMTIV